MDRKCENCEYWHKENDNYGSCRIRSPRTIVAGGIGEEPEYSLDWPAMKKNNWCGEFNPKGKDI